MPYWKPEEELELIELIKEGLPLEEVAAHLSRSVDAVSMKLRRLGFSVPRESAAKKTADKVTTNTTTTTGEPIQPAEDLISVEEALKLMLSALQRLKDPSISSAEVKRIRLLISGLKGYVIIQQNYYVRMLQIEKSLQDMMRSQIVQFQALKDRETREAKKAEWEREIRDLEQSLAGLEAPPKPFEQKRRLSR